MTLILNIAVERIILLENKHKDTKNTKITKVGDRKSVIFISLCFLFFRGKIW